MSAFLWGGAPRRLLEAAGSERIRLFTSRALIEELERVLTREKFTALLEQSRFSAAYLISRYTRLAQITAVTTVAPVVTADPDDDEVLACAVAAKADLIASGDRDLLTLKEHRGIQIVSVVETLRRIGLP